MFSALEASWHFIIGAFEALVQVVLQFIATKTQRHEEDI
jgi:hypothetical protein